jgi:cell division septation protein DedD
VAYEFSFERGQLVKVIGGVAALVVLVFCAGFLTGIALQSREAEPVLVARATQPRTNVVQAPPTPATPSQPITSNGASDVDVTGNNETTIELDQADIADKPAVSESDESGQTGIPGTFAVQLGAFLRPENAGLLATKLEGKGYNADVVAREDSHGRTWYLVRYGIFPNRAEATAVALEMRTQENLDALVRPSDSM